MDRIRELETEKRAAKRTLYNTNKRKKKLRQKVATMKQVLAEHLQENDQLKERLSKFEGKLTFQKQQKFSYTFANKFRQSLLYRYILI